MAWLPPSAPHDALARIPLSDWEKWAEGGPLGEAPHNVPHDMWACEINRDFPDELGRIQYRKGMQGVLLEEKFFSQSGRMAKIFIRGVTEVVQGSTNRWVPYENVTKGQRWRTNVHDWTVDIDLSVQTFQPQRWKTSPPDTTVLGKTIAKLIAGFHEAPPSYLGRKLNDLIEKYGMDSLNTAIIQGIKEAGVYDILTSPDFKATDLDKAARYHFHSESSNKKAGIYVRLHKAGPSVTYWTPGTSYAYVGKSTDFAARFKGHATAQSTYGILNKNSSKLSMFAVCILGNGADSGLFYLFDQIFVCLLQTYKQDILTPTPGKRMQDLTLVQTAGYCHALSEEVFRLTGWCGAIARPSFEIERGANSSSPLFDWSRESNRTLFIRTDAAVKDNITGKLVDTAFFRRAEMKKMQAPSSGTMAQLTWVSVFDIGDREQQSVQVIQFGLHIEGNDSLLAPPPGTPYQLVFEVRKDGSPHSHAWSRLCEIGRFENWDQARSLAARIEWEYPPGSGRYRQRYLHAGRRSGGYLTESIDPKIPGALIVYGKAICFIRYLFNAKTSHGHKWLWDYSGSARVLMANYDLMKQHIRLEAPTSTFHMMPGKARSDAEIISQMKHPKYGLENVNGPFGTFTASTSAIGGRTKCDTCALMHKGAKDSECVRVGQSRVCTNCVRIGRPCCSWTSSIEAGKGLDFRSPLSAEAKGIRDRAAVGLLYQPIEEVVPDASQWFELVLRALDSSADTDNNEDDGSGEELDNDESVDAGKVDE